MPTVTFREACDMNYLLSCGKDNSLPAFTWLFDGRLEKLLFEDGIAKGNPHLWRTYPKL